ncbi:MAG: hypothetical protein ACLUE1_05395 [Adlercreutzia equolifaciens]
MAERYVAGDINARQLSDMVDDYYTRVERGINRPPREAARPAHLRRSDSNGFTFSPTLRAIHGRLFRGLMEGPSRAAPATTTLEAQFGLRESVAYGDYASLEDDLNRLLGVQPAPAQEATTVYIASVVADHRAIWRIHPREAGIRAPSPFLQQLLHFHGFPKTAASA